MFEVSLPFHFELTRRIDSGYAKVQVNGVVRAEPDAVVVEFRETITPYVGMKTSQGPVQQLRVPLEQIEAVTLRRPWFRAATLTLRAHSLKTFAEYPYADGACAVFPIARADRQSTRRLIDVLAERRADAEIRRLERGNAG